MHQFVRNLITEWRRLELPFGEATIVVAVSGGADSVSLLLALSELKERKKLAHRLVAAHFNHGLRDGASDADADFVRDLATSLNIELAVEKASSLPTKGNLEQNARRARYAFLLKTAVNLNAFAVLTGHTVNDQAETVLMNLLRGSGPDGLSGMRTIRALAAEKGPDPDESDGHGAQPSTLPFQQDPLLIRPLLTWAKRVDTEAYCHSKGVEYRYDTMNEDTAFKRVKIRKILLPLLQDFNPRIVEALGNTAKLMQDITDRLAPETDDPLPAELVLADLKACSKSELYEIIRSWLRQRRGTTRRLQLKHIDAVARLVLSVKSGRAAELPGGQVIKRDGRLLYEEIKVEN